MLQFGLSIATAEQSVFLGCQTGSETTQANQANLGSTAPAIPSLGNENVIAWQFVSTAGDF